MQITEENGWAKIPNAPGYHKAVPFDSPLGERILNDLAIHYPHFKPKYIGQEHVSDGAPDMVAAYALGPEDVRVEYVNKDAPPPDDLLDIACVMYTLDGNVLTFYGMNTNYDIFEWHRIRPELREFHETYRHLKQSAPHVVTMIEQFATIYEQQIAGYNGTYEPLALRQLLWNFARFLLQGE